MKESSSINDLIHRKLELSETFKKCQSLINMQRLMLIKEYGVQNHHLLEKYYLTGDMTNKQSNEVINKRIKNIFNMNNYEQNIKKEAWQKDLTKMYLGLNDENKGKSENAFFDYNYNNRNKKKEGLIFIKNFFGKMKSAKKIKNLYNKKNSIIKSYQKNFFDKIKKNDDKNKKIITKEEKEKEMNKIWDTIKIKYNSSFKDISEDDLHKKNIQFFTEINNIRKKNLFKIKSPISRNQKSKKFFVPEIATSNSSKVIFNSKFKEYKNKYRNKTKNEKLKKVYEGKYKYMTLNSESNKLSRKNFEMPELLEERKIRLFKKNNIIFLSSLHFSKYVQMTEIKNNLIKEGFLDKDVFKICNKKI